MQSVASIRNIPLPEGISHRTWNEFDKDCSLTGEISDFLVRMDRATIQDQVSELMES
jgi:hypothetical protein